MAVHEFWKQLGEKDEFNNRKMRATASRSRVADNAAMSRFKRTGSSLLLDWGAPSRGGQKKGETLDTILALSVAAG